MRRDLLLMALRRVRLEEVQPFGYAFGGSIKARMGDTGRSVGSQSIGLAIQTVALAVARARIGTFGRRKSCQEEIVIVMAGQGAPTSTPAWPVDADDGGDQ